MNDWSRDGVMTKLGLGTVRLELKEMLSSLYTGPRAAYGNGEAGVSREGAHVVRRNETDRDRILCHFENFGS